MRLPSNHRHLIDHLIQFFSRQKVHILLFSPAAAALKSRDNVKECVCCRVSLLELVLAQLQEEGSECGVAPGVAQFLADSFQTNCGAVLKLSTESCVSDDEVRRVHWWENSLFFLVSCFH